MRKENPVIYSSAVGESWQHCEFKVKYCHCMKQGEFFDEVKKPRGEQNFPRKISIWLNFQSWKFYEVKFDFFCAKNV
jgi:hypothetical protein